jgi:hypothetical protein
VPKGEEPETPEPEVKTIKVTVPRKAALTNSEAA